MRQQREKNHLANGAHIDARHRKTADFPIRRINRSIRTAIRARRRIAVVQQRGIILRQVIHNVLVERRELRYIV